MWYLYMILLLYLLTPALKWILQRISRMVVYFVMAFLLLGSSILPFLMKLFEWEQMVVLPGGGIYFFYYICGYLFASAEGEEVKKRKGDGKRGSVGRYLAWIALLGLLGGMVCSRLVGDYSVQMAYNYPFTVVASLLMMWLAWSGERISDMMNKSSSALYLVKMSGLSFAIYLIHPVFLNVLYKFFHITLLDFSIWFSLPGVFLIVLLLSTIVAWVLYQIPMLRKWIL